MFSLHVFLKTKTRTHYHIWLSQVLTFYLYNIKTNAQNHISQTWTPVFILSTCQEVLICLLHIEQYSTGKTNRRIMCLFIPATSHDSMALTYLLTSHMSEKHVKSHGNPKCQINGQTTLSMTTMITVRGSLYDGWPIITRGGRLYACYYKTPKQIFSDQINMSPQTTYLMGTHIVLHLHNIHLPVSGL